MREFIDTYLTKLVNDSIKCTKKLPPKFFLDANAFNDSGEIQKRAEDICKLLVDSDHVKTLISIDAEADAKSRHDRIVYLQNLKFDTYSAEHKTAIECVLISELLLAMDSLSLEQIVYHRARTFAYSLIFILKASLIPIFLLGTSAMIQTCQFALAAVLLDDAEDAEEDRLADSPTLFTRGGTEATTTAYNIMAHLEYLDKARSQLVFLDTREFLLMAYNKVDEFSTGKKKHGLDTKLLLRRLAREHWSDSWRGI